MTSKGLKEIGRILELKPNMQEANLNLLKKMVLLEKMMELNLIPSKLQIIIYLSKNGIFDLSPIRLLLSSMFVKIASSAY